MTFTERRGDALADELARARAQLRVMSIVAGAQGVLVVLVIGFRLLGV